MRFFHTVFVASDLSKSRQKLVSNFEMIVGNIAPKSTKTIYLNVLSLIDGTIDLEQIVLYQIANDHDRFKAESVKHELNPKLSNVQKDSHNVTLQYIDDAVIKSKKDTIIIQCVTEFVCTGRFLSLNKNALTQAIKCEDFFLQIQLEIKSTDIEILDIFLISVCMHEFTTRSFIIQLNIGMANPSRVKDRESTIESKIKKR